MEHAILPQNILMLTFTNKAAKEMKDRVIALLGDNAKYIAASTFHSFCVNMLRRFGSRIGLSPNFTVLAAGDDMDVIKIVKALDKQRYNYKGFPNAKTIVNYISKSINTGKTIEQVMKGTKYEQFTADVIQISRDADKYKYDNHLMNYDDLLVYMNKMLDTNPNVAKNIAELYPYIMVDEYQDTNPLQESILKYLFKYTKNIAVVGDDMQSLYGFRGAEVENIIDFPNRFAGCKKIFLTRNYRSNQEILDLSNYVVSKATEGFEKKLAGAHHSGNLPKLISTFDQYEEAEAVCDMISEIHKEGTPYNDICVLFRNSVLSAQLELLLNKYTVPYVKYGGMKFFDLSYVKDVLSYLRIMLNPYDEIAWFRVVQVHYGIGDVYARSIASGCKKDDFQHLLDKKYKRKRFGKDLNLLYEQLQRCEALPLVPLLKSFIDFYIEITEKNIANMDTDEGTRTEMYEENKLHKQELQKLIDIAANYNSLNQYLDDMMLDNSKKRMDPDTEGNVVLSTIHSVKGLEFNTVIILDSIDGIFPSTTEFEIGSKSDNEELRCFYVAVTRAKERLFLMAPKNAMRYNEFIIGREAHYLDGGEKYYYTI